MISQNVNPTGSLWAGAWNDSSTAKVRSAVWIVDFNGYAAKPCMFKDGTCALNVSWADDKTVRVVTSDSADPAKVSKCGLVYIDADTGKEKRSVSLDQVVSNVLCWPDGSDKFAAVLAGGGKQVKLAVLDESGKTVGKEIAVDMPKDSGLYSEAGMAADGSSFVFSVSDPAAKDGRAYYLADAQQGSVKRIFELGDVPGRIEGMWPSKDGVLMVCMVNDKLETLVYDAAAGKINPLPAGIIEADLKAKWPSAPKSMMFMTYKNAYEFSLIGAKTKTVFDLTKLDSASDKSQREALRDSRLYPLKSGMFISISEAGGGIDIRELKNNGALSRNLLPRF